jgi:hypothetical protein
MKGVDKFPENVRPYAKSYVTFGNGDKGKIVDIEDIVSEGSPRLNNVLLVKGLAANLISISQLCDQVLSVNFSKTECKILDEKGKVSMKGTRSKDNCYLWSPQEQAFISSCMLSKDEEVRLWHQKLGHLNMQGIKKAISLEAIKDIPKLEITERSIYGECQVGKQTRMSHPRLEHQGTSKAIELLHIDLMGPMQVASIGGKKYVVVDIDELDLDDVPLAHTLGDSVAKRLRSNKGKYVLSASKTFKKITAAVIETPKNRTKSSGVGPKKGWSKVMVKNVAGNSRKRKVVSSSESEYDVEEDVLNIIPSDVKKSVLKKSVQIMENVPIDKVSFHLPEFAQRRKYTYHSRLVV